MKKILTPAFYPGVFRYFARSIRRKAYQIDLVIIGRQ
jgi:hypothetical protein